ncbi:MAG TPA: patatin-like phospholipase family protein [Arenimonas sp.]|nr:patatin-like phospholipase family protein [Arenimonas sp.]
MSFARAINRSTAPTFLLCGAVLLLASCANQEKRPAPPAVTTPTPAVVPVPKIRIGLALGGGAAKGFAHIGVIKMLEANGFRVETVAGTSAGSVVGAMYASGMNSFQMQQKAIALDESTIRDVSLFSGGLLKGQKLQDYVNTLVQQRPIERMKKPFAAVATKLETGERIVFTRGNTGQAVRASSSIPGVFEPVVIGKWHYVDGGIVSPVPVDAARQLGADMVIAVDISSKASGKNPDGLLGIVNQAISIMGQKLGEQELARADVVIRPRVGNIGPTEFEQRNQAIIEGEKAALAALPQIRARIAQLQKAKMTAAIKNINNLSADIKIACEAPTFTDRLFDNALDCKTKN